MKTDYKQKRIEIYNKIHEEIFVAITDDDLYNKEFDKEGNLIHIKRNKLSVKKNEIMPILTTTRVQTQLESIMRLYMPMNYNEARQLEPEDYLSAYSNYCTLIDSINKYVIFKTTKPSFCAFAGITVETFNNLMNDDVLGTTMKWIKDGLEASSFIDSASGLFDSKAVITEGQTKDSGLGMVKNPEALVFSNNTFINKQEIDKQLALFEGMAGIKKLTNKKE